ncbi:hypothetical protein H5410_064610, partial [Solanum commersonii]
GSRIYGRVHGGEPILEPKPCENIQRQGSKEGFDGGRVQGGEPILEPKPCENILSQGSKEGFKDGGRVHGDEPILNTSLSLELYGTSYWCGWGSTKPLEARKMN